MTMIRRSLLLGLPALLLPNPAGAQDGPQPPLRKERISIITLRGKPITSTSRWRSTRASNPSA